MRPLSWGVNALAAAAMTAPAFAAEDAARRVTFTKDVLPIFQENCVICHRPGGANIAGMVAPMSLTDYEEARPWAKAIEQVVTEKVMPPWYASEEFSGHFQNERGLTDAEIATLVRWVRSGAPRGNPNDAPPPLEFEDTGGWVAGQPDLVIKLPEPYWVKDEVTDEYAYFTAEISKEQLPEDRWLRSVEWRPDSKVVHHIVGSEIYADADGEPMRQSLGSIAPGEEPHVFPPGYGKKLRAGSKIYFSMHYHKEPGEGTGAWDQSMVGFRFWDQETDPPVRHNMIWRGISNGTFEIPPGENHWEVGAAITFDEDTLIHSLHPHMHLRGKDAKYVAVYPDGRREPLLFVPKWDFDWQLDYSYAEPKLVPAGTRVEFLAHYDNSTENEANPDATIPVRWGGPTTDEMMIGFIHYCAAEPQELDVHDMDEGDRFVESD